MMEIASHPAESLEFLSRLHDGDLEPAEAAAFESHRTGCADCRAAVAEFERALSAYREAPVAPVASDLSARILRKIRTVSPSRRPFGVMFGIDVRWAGVLAAALLVVIIGAPVFSRRSTAGAPEAARPSGPIPAYVLDAEETRSAGKVAGPPGPPAPETAKSEAAGPPAARKDAPASAAAPPLEEQKRIADSAPIDTLETAAPAAPLLSRSRAVSAPAGGLTAVMESSPSPAIRLDIFAIDGQGAAPVLASAPPDERLAPLRGGRFVLVVEADGRVSTVETLRTEKKAGEDRDRAAADTAAAPAEGAEGALRDLLFRPGAGTRRLTVAVR